MARQYPRFLFSDPKNTKSEGPFVVHTMNPFIVAKVGRNEGIGYFIGALPNCITDGEYNIAPLNIKEFDESTRKVLSDMIRWVSQQVTKGYIHL